MYVIVGIFVLFKNILEWLILSFLPGAIMSDLDITNLRTTLNEFALKDCPALLPA